MAIRLAPILIGAILLGCTGDSDQASCLDRPTGSSVNIASIDDVFSIMLNTKNRDDRYSATLYLKSHLGDETVKHYGTLLFKVSHPPGRIKIYESMGFFGGNANASLLAHYLQTEEEVDAKAQIICSLGHIGPDVAQFARLVEEMKVAYPRHYSTRESQGGSILVRSREIAWIIRDNSMSPEQFSRIADESIRKIRSDGGGTRR